MRDNDGKKIGIEWNKHLTLAKFQHLLVDLPTQERPTNGETSMTFDVDPDRDQESDPGPNPDLDHEYLVWVYIPDDFFRGTEEYRVEGNEVKRNLKELFKDGKNFPTGRFYSGHNRYVSLGNHLVSDGKLNVTWNKPNAAERIFIRQLPTRAEAYQWIPDLPEQPGQKPGAPINAFTLIEAEWFRQEEGVGRVDRVHPGTPDDGIGRIDNADWVSYPGVNFGNGDGPAEVRVLAASKNSGVIEFRLNSVDGPLLASCPIGDTGGWKSPQWFSAAVKEEVRQQAQDKHDLFLVFKGPEGSSANLMNVDAFEFIRAN